MSERYDKEHRIPPGAMRVPTDEEVKSYYLPFVIKLAKTLGHGSGGFDPEAVAIETLAIAIWRYNGTSHFDTYLQMILKTAFSADRKKNRGHASLEDEEDSLSILSTDGGLGQVDLLQSVPVLLEALPWSERTIVVYYYYADFTLGEIAILTGWSATKVGRLLQSAKDRLKEILEPRAHS